MNKYLLMGWMINEMRRDERGWYYFSAEHYSGESASANGDNYAETWSEFCDQMNRNVPQWYKDRTKEQK